MKIEIMIPSCLVALIVFVVLFNVGRSNYLEVKKEKFDLKNTFPYEMQSQFNAKYNWHVRFISLFFALAMSLFAVNAFDITFMSILSIITGLMIINAIAIMLLFIIDMRRASLHMAIAVIHFGLTFLSYVLVAYYVFFVKSSDYPLAMGIICLTFALMILLLCINPKLYKWMFMEKVEEEGKVELKRPKVIMLALYEWIFIALAISLNLIITIFTVLM